MVALGSDTLHPDLARGDTIKEVYFRVTSNTQHDYRVEDGGYLTADKQLWVPSWASVWKKILPDYKHYKQSYKEAITIDGEWYAPKGVVATTLGASIPFNALPPLPSSFKKHMSLEEQQSLSDQQASWEKQPKFCRFFQPFKEVQTVSYHTGQDDWTFCPVDDTYSL